MFGGKNDSAKMKINVKIRTMKCEWRETLDVKVSIQSCEITY